MKKVGIYEGYSMPGFPGPDVFLALITPKLETLIEPCVDLLHQVYMFVDQLAHSILVDSFSLVPELSSEIAECVSGLI